MDLKSLPTPDRSVKSIGYRNNDCFEGTLMGKGTNQRIYSEDSLLCLKDLWASVQLSYG